MMMRYWTHPQNDGMGIKMQGLPDRQHENSALGLKSSSTHVF